MESKRVFFVAQMVLRVEERKTFLSHGKKNIPSKGTSTNIPQQSKTWTDLEKLGTGVQKLLDI